MESPVRICIGAAVVVRLLLLCSTTIRVSALPPQTTTTSTNDNDRVISARYAKINDTTWVSRGRTRSLDVALNELSPKDSVSQEHADTINSKYKDRGRVKFHSSIQAATRSSAPKRLVKTSTTGPKYTIVTPTPEKKNLSQIIDRMREYKKTKIPVKATSSSPLSFDEPENDSKETIHHFFDDEDDNSDDIEFGYKGSESGKHSTDSFHESNNFFSIPEFSEDNFSHDNYKDHSDLKSYSVSPYEKSNKYKSDYKATNTSTFNTPYSDFDIDLTTPRNDYFDKRFKEISNSIKTKLDSILKKSPNSNVTKMFKASKNNVNEPISISSKNIPQNRSTVYIKNTKQIRLLDNEGAGTSNKELSDVQGTSIYYEMSVLSTESYGIDYSNDGDCDNDTSSHEPTSSTTTTNVSPTKPTHENFIINSAKSTNTYSAQALISKTPAPITDQITTTEPTVVTTKSVNKSVSSNYRSRGYSKRINFTNNRENVNSVADQVTSNQVYKPVTRRIQYTTPKSKPIWMTPMRNSTKPFYTRTSFPTTIYAEYFNVKDNAVKPQSPPFITTVPSDIDPVSQSYAGDTKEVANSHSPFGNTIPQLRKRGFVKFGTSTVSSAENDTDTDKFMEMPPTLTAWALAGLRATPSLSSSIENNTVHLQKAVDEEELQTVGDYSNIAEMSKSSTSRTTSSVSNDLSEKIINDVEQNKLHLKSTEAETSSKPEVQTVMPSTEPKPERLPAESNISIQTTVQPSTTEAADDDESLETDGTTTEQVVPGNIDWVMADKTETAETTTHKSISYQSTGTDNVLVTGSTKTTRFESITKLPSGVTTPQIDILSSNFETTVRPDKTVRPSDSEIPSNIISTTPKTSGYEITTIRFSYIPTILDGLTDGVEPQVTTDVWHPVTIDTTKATTLNDAPITTYRPQYVTTTEIDQETSTMSEITSKADTSSATELSAITSTVELSTEVPITKEEVFTNQYAVETTTQADTTTVQLMTSESVSPQNDNSIRGSSEENSGSNEVISHAKETTTTSGSMIEDDEYTAVLPMTTTEIDVTSEAFDKSYEESDDASQKMTVLTKTTTEFMDTTIQSISTTEMKQTFDESTTTETGTQTNNEFEELEPSYSGEMTTNQSPIVLNESGSGAAVAIAVSTIGVIALILLVGLLLVVRKRNHRGMYAQRCTPVSLDAYSLDSVGIEPRKGHPRMRASKRSYGNPAYDDEVTSHPMQYAALANFALDIDSITAEFTEIPSVTVKLEDVPAGCEDKNRYSNVLPLPETRVPLQRIGSDPTTEYINANFITGPGNIKNYYIASQGPLANTVADFWRMVWEQNTRLVVMLTEYMENGVEKCYEYLPPSEISDNRRTFGDYQIILKSREQRDKYAISTVQITNLGTRTWREVTHLWYFWPAKGMPDNYDSIIDFLSEMRSYMKTAQTAKEFDEQGVEIIYGADSRSSFQTLNKLKNEDNGSGNGVNVYSPQRAEEQMRRSAVTNGTLSRMKAASEVEGVRPCVVVCPSGAGRSAAVIALDICARALASGLVDVPRVVREIRAQRPHSLTNKHHYILLYKVLSEYGNKLMGVGMDAI